jgi:hypothetical protein
VVLTGGCRTLRCLPREDDVQRHHLVAERASASGVGNGVSAAEEEMRIGWSARRCFGGLSIV